MYIMKKGSLQSVKEIYERGGNIIQHLKDGDLSKVNTSEMIQISYDLQSGRYIKFAKGNTEYIENYTKAIAKAIDGLGGSYDSILEVGVGEATTLAHLIPKLKDIPDRVFGFDLAWSRIRYGIEYLKSNNVNAVLFMGDLFHIPLADNSIDVVYTSHSIEPNSGMEKEALTELIRVTKKYLVLLEPSYELADADVKRRMEEHGYIKNLHSSALALGLNIIEHRLFEVTSNPLNPTELMVIEKEQKEQVGSSVALEPFICPVTKTKLELINGSYFSHEGLLAYPIIDGVACLTEDNAVIATHYTDDFGSGV
jgi:uncharacterized protein YbaR (Trm112 family)